MRTLACFLVLASLAAPLAPAQGLFPAVPAQDLSGKKVDFPALAKGKVVAVILGFTHSSQAQTKTWSQRIGSDPEAYSIAVLQDVPRLIRGMVAGSIRNSIPQKSHDHFLLVYTGEKDLKQVAGFDPPDDAYLLLLGRDGAIRWRFHGPCTVAALASLKEQAATLAGAR